MFEPRQHEPTDRVDKGAELLDEIRPRLPSRTSPEEAVRAVMCTFSQHISGAEARHVFHLLPASLHHLLERCMLHRREEAEPFDRDQLIVRVAEHLGVSLAEAERAASVVLKAISSRLPEREVEVIANQLSQELRALWVDEAAIGAHAMFFEVAERVRLPRAVTGQRAVMYVMCNLTRRLSKREAHALVDGLPHEVRLLLEPCLAARAEQGEHFTRLELLDHVSKDLHVHDSEPIVRTVIEVVKRYLRPEVIERVGAQLPVDFKPLWSRPDEYLH